MTSAYEWIITTRSFHRTRIELSSTALSLTLTAEQNIWIIQIVRKIVLKKKYTFPDFNNIPVKAEILITIYTYYIHMQRRLVNTQDFDEKAEKVRVKMADLAGRWNQKEGLRKVTRPPVSLPKHTQSHPKPHQRRDTPSLERKGVQESSCVPFNLKNGLRLTKFESELVQ